MAAADGDLRVGVRWSKEEDKRLRDKLASNLEGGLFKTSINIDWEDVSKYVGGRRNATMCENRWCQMANQPGKGLAFSDAEDLALKNMVTQEGLTKWSEIATRLGTGRVGKQCRERWYNHLDPTLKKSTPWSAEEEGLLFSQQEKIGNQWKEISHMIPGRSENDCKNKFNTTMRCDIS